MSYHVSRWIFGPFTLDEANACLWRGDEAVALPPKAFDVLHYLVMHPGRLVTKDELLDAVWPETAVSDAVVRVAIGALRKALDDTQPPARFIATVPWRGYPIDFLSNDCNDTNDNAWNPELHCEDCLGNGSVL
jgi:DNA-binding winged helix-turn-helix (wHTH) protein